MLYCKGISRSDTWKGSMEQRSAGFRNSTTHKCACVSAMADADVEVEGVPVAPLDVRCHDANRDYVVVTWKQPAVEGSSSILGYYIDRLVGDNDYSGCDTVLRTGHQVKQVLSGLHQNATFTDKYHLPHNDNTCIRSICCSCHSFCSCLG